MPKDKLEETKEVSPIEEQKKQSKIITYTKRTKRKKTS